MTTSDFIKSTQLLHISSIRIFSGTQPVQAVKEQFDYWLEQAWLMVEESECTERKGEG